MLHAEFVFVASIHPSRTWMLGCFESVQWNACVHMFTPKEKSPLLEEFTPEEDKTHNAASSRTASPTHYQQAISAPKAGVWSQVCQSWGKRPITPPLRQSNNRKQFVACLTSQQHVSVSQGRTCSDNFMWDRSCRPNFPSHPVTVYWLWAKQSQHWPYNARRLAGLSLLCQFLSHWYYSTPEKSWRKRDSNPGSSALKADALTTRPMRQYWMQKSKQGNGSVRETYSLAPGITWQEVNLTHYWGQVVVVVVVVVVIAAAVVVIIIAFKGTNQDFLQSPHYVTNRLKQIRSSGLGAIVSK